MRNDKYFASISDSDGIFETATSTTATTTTITATTTICCIISRCSCRCFRLNE
jgi:hypothetical protein